MRYLLSAVFGMVFLAAFVGFFLMSSITDYVDSPDRLVESASKGGMRDAIVEHTAEYIAEEVAADPTLKSMSVSELRGIVGGVITTEWLEDSLALAHKALKSAIRGVEATAVLNLREIKAALSRALSDLKNRAEDNCIELLGADACSDAHASKLMVATFEARALAAVGQLHDEIDLMEQLQGADREDAAQLQKGLESMETVRMLALVVLILSLALFVAINSRPFSRLAMSTGTLAIVSCVVYLLVIEVSESRASDEMAKHASGEMSSETATLGARLANQLVGDAIAGSTLPVVMTGIGGAILVGLAILLRRRTR